jgi:hypothetical protein
MINIKIAGISYSLPLASNMSINRFCDFLDWADGNEPKEENTNQKAWLEYYAKSIAYWTGAPLSDVRKCKVDDIVGVYMVHQKYLMPAEDLTFNCFELQSDIYYLPKRFMTESTIEDFAEADEYQKQLRDYQNGNYKALSKVAAVICRKEGESFGDYDVEERAKMFGDNLTATDSFQIGFFLNRQSEKLATDSQIYTTSRILNLYKQELSN